MKSPVEKRKPSGVIDYVALAVTTFGVGYIPGAPGTYGSLVGVGLYLSWGSFLPVYIFDPKSLSMSVWHAVTAVLLLIFCLVGVWASGRSTGLLGDLDPSQAVVDEVMGQLIVFLFVPFGIGWPFIVAGFLLFRLFDIWKPYPIDDLQILPGGIGVCGDDILAGVYAGVCLSIVYAISLSL
ncbi:MAG: phosphatidylglycerophosphatase A [Pyrinomonadaceae bacterium]